jgi:uncharacterized membrane protein
MPYRWHSTTHLTLWPHRSLSARGFVVFIGITAVLLAVPLLSQLGNPSLWVLLPFLLAAVAAIWIALRKNHRDREILEELTLTADSITLTHRKGRATPQSWEGNPYWARPTLYKTGGKVPNYLTLKGSGREVELGAFLTEAERLALKSELDRTLAALR